MAKILIVMRHEFLAMVRKRSFWIGLIGVPLFIGVIMAITILASGTATAAAIASRQDEAEVQGYVDLSGIIKIVPEGAGMQAFPDEAAAQVALEANQISGYFVVAADYLATGAITYVAPQFSILESPTDEFERVVQLNLIGGNLDALQQLNTPVKIAVRQALAPKETAGGAGAPFPLVPIFSAVMFSIVLISASSYLMQSVTTEKENRVMEVLMSSMTPTQMLAGKVLGLGLVGLIQMGLWLLSALAALNYLPASFSLGTISPFTVFVAMVFFVLGYFIYASLMAGLGALMPGTREAAQYTFFIILPLIIPLWLNTAIALEPNSTLAVALSLIPFTSPVAMVMRMTATDVPLWQIALAFVLLIVTVSVVIVLVARVFRAQALLSGTKPKLSEIVTALR